MATINPVNCVFTVTVEFKSSVYDVEITPTINGVAMPWKQASVDAWKLAESTNHIFSRKIKEMLDSGIPDYSLATHGVITEGSVKGFTLESGEVIHHTTQEIWRDFIACLQTPASFSCAAARDPVAAETGIGARTTYTRNEYLSLDKGAPRRDIRLSLYKKRSCESKGMPFDPYTPAEIACYAHLFPHKKTRLLPGIDKKNIIDLELFAK
jgi:hypothetical protein